MEVEKEKESHFLLMAGCHAFAMVRPDGRRDGKAIAAAMRLLFRIGFGVGVSLVQPDCRAAPIALVLVPR
jgi:hypothetical protein